MPASNGSNDGSPFDDLTEEVMADSEEAERLAEAARAASDDPSTVAKAERTLEKAFDTDSERRRAKILERALEIDPGCVAALTIASQQFSEPTDVAEVLEAALEVGERRLGKTFEQAKGRFWEVYETRPYLRALCALAEAEMDAMDYGAGLALYQRVLDLAETDGLGIRYVLAGALLAADRIEDARKLVFERYGSEDSPQMLWARTLILFVERDFEAASAMLERARDANEFVEDYLTGAIELSGDPPAIYSPGSNEEAELIARDQLLAWRSRPLALVWAQVGGQPGDDRYFGALTDVDLQTLFDELDDDEFDPELDQDDDEDEGPYLLH